ncbi:MAG: ubiquinone biosynthesis protein COQ4 [Leptolyngbyaceae cyanobacterium HOT.MB2.61]|nr:ubiquinone biosynthesis protein COQ4 [Leptolyngbyaceae cyanobacterium HOT.MB2.61]
MASTTVPNGKFVQHFLAIADQIGEVLGANVPPFVDLETLRQLPEGTLGRTLVDFLEQHNLSPLTSGPRRKQLHDSVHVLTGYGTDPIGEAEEQAFLLGAKFNPIQILLGLGLLHVIQRQSPERQPKVHQRLWRAYRRGRASCFDIDAWQPEEQWHLPLVQVQAIFQVSKMS